MSAKELFKQLGYEIDEENEKEILYKMKWEISSSYYVAFDIENKNINVFETSDSPFTPHCNYDIGIDLLQAINKQCSELGWFD